MFNGKKVIMFDCDGTLINLFNEPRYDVILTYQFLYNLPDTYMVIASGGGADYALNVATRLGLKADLICSKMDINIEVDICFDDMDAEFGKVNIKV